MKPRPRFFIPAHHLPPEDRRAAWESGTGHPILEQSGKSACAQCWIYQTWQELADRAELVTTLPDSGIVVGLSGTLPAQFQPPAEMFLIDVVADGDPHPSAHWHVVQNAAHARRLPRSTFIPLWGQPGLIPRAASRARIFENIDFFGDPPNLAGELATPEFADHLHSLTGLRLRFRNAASWHDYRTTDCAIGIRSFSRKKFLHKPSTKMYNAWTAGVPFIGGPESGLLSDARAGQDFLLCRSPADVIAALKTLQSSPALQSRLIRNGALRLRHFDRTAVRKRWIHLLNDLAPNRARQRARYPRPVLYAADHLHRVMLEIDRRSKN